MGLGIQLDFAYIYLHYPPFPPCYLFLHLNPTYIYVLRYLSNNSNSYLYTLSAIPGTIQAFLQKKRAFYVNRRVAKWQKNQNLLF